MKETSHKYYEQDKVHLSVGGSNPIFACDCRFDYWYNISKHVLIMKKNNHTLAFMLIIITLVFVTSMFAQSVVLNGRQFSVVGNSKRAEAFDSVTVYTYRDTNDSIYTVHLSKNLKAFIIRYSGKTGKPYRKYLPKITEQLNQMRQ